MTDRPLTFAGLREATQRTVTVPLPDLGGDIVLRSITRAELMEVRETVGFTIHPDRSISVEDPQRLDLLILLRSWVEPADLHETDDPEAALADLPTGLLQELAAFAYSVSGLSADARFLDRTPDDAGS